MTSSPCVPWTAVSPGAWTIVAARPLQTGVAAAACGGKMP